MALRLFGWPRVAIRWALFPAGVAVLRRVAPLELAERRLPRIRAHRLRVKLRSGGAKITPIISASLFFGVAFRFASFVVLGVLTVLTGLLSGPFSATR